MPHFSRCPFFGHEYFWDNTMKKKNYIFSINFRTVKKQIQTIEVKTRKCYKRRVECCYLHKNTVNKL